MRPLSRARVGIPLGVGNPLGRVQWRVRWWRVAYRDQGWVSAEATDHAGIEYLELVKKGAGGDGTFCQGAGRSSRGRESRTVDR